MKSQEARVILLKSVSLFLKNQMALHAAMQVEALKLSQDFYSPECEEITAAKSGRSDEAEAKTDAHGGSRIGAGRAAISPWLRKKTICVRLPLGVIAEIKRRAASRGKDGRGVALSSMGKEVERAVRIAQPAPAKGKKLKS